MTCPIAQAETNFCDSQLFSTILTLVVTLIAASVGFWFSQRNERKKKKEEESEAYKNLLLSAWFELRAYKGKLEILSDMIRKIVERQRAEIAQIGNHVVEGIPSFSLYPQMLKEIQSKLCSFMLTPKVVELIGTCHFELSHIRERLDRVQQASQGTENAYPLYTKNLEGFVELINNSRDRVFPEALQAVEKEILRFGGEIPKDEPKSAGEPTTGNH